MEEGTEHTIGESDLKAFLSVAKALSVQDKVDLEWSHDYVTRGGASGPDRPVTKLAPAHGMAQVPQSAWRSEQPQAAYNFGAASPRLIPLVYGVEAPGTPGKQGSAYAAQEPDSICNVVVTEWAAVLKAAGIRRTLCLLKPAELACYSPPGYATLLEQEGLTPACESLKEDGAWARISDTLLSAEAAGDKIAVHCSAGEGRTGVVLAAFLAAHKGLSVEAAVAEVAEAAAAASVVRKCDVATVAALLANGRA